MAKIRKTPVSAFMEMFCQSMEKAGPEIAKINPAHDSELWIAFITQLRRDADVVKCIEQQPMEEYPKAVVGDELHLMRLALGWGDVARADLGAQTEPAYDGFRAALFYTKTPPNIGDLNPPGEITMDGYKRVPVPIDSDGFNLEEVTFDGDRVHEPDQVTHRVVLDGYGIVAAVSRWQCPSSWMPT